MKKFRDFFLTATFLMALSGILYYFHYLYFGHFRDTMYYTFLDISFIPINILIVTLVFNNILERKEKNRILEKLNVLITLFFNEIGRKLMDILISGDEEARGIIKDFSNLKEVEKALLKHPHNFDIHKINIEELYKILCENKSFIISLLGNENLHENESFSELLMAIIHLTDEIGFRKDKGITSEDLEHLQGDVARVYKAITLQWVGYLKHLKNNYPYLYSSATSFNPYN
ncbi:hypothetical protein GCM10008905_31890 [Clostridium malenominatum]|uniref:Uncharacterized protein n=1 Tax=Clostridium malenominatum TaxID=1539 RepID=A0ABP3UF35_9CLOT